MAAVEHRSIEAQEAEPQAKWPTPPAYRFPPAGPSRLGPRLLSQIKAGLRHSRPAHDGKEKVHSSAQRFWRSARWSPDGTHLLCQAEDHVVDLFRLSANDEGAYMLKHLLSVPLPSPILDTAWYPLARYDEPQSWCFVVSARDVPIRLVDAYSGSTRASYIIIDHTERFVGPHALAFSPDGQCLYAAHAHTLSIFNVAVPTDGAQQLQIIPSRRAPRGTNPGQKGLVSSLSVCAANDGGDAESGADIVALGTFAGTIGLYRIPHRSLAQKLEIQQTLVAGWREADQASVTQLSFHATAPWILFVGTRGAQRVTAYDTRYLSAEADFRKSAPDAARVGYFERSVAGRDKGRTQQKLHFDLDWGGRCLVGGDKEGIVRAWNVRVDGASYEGDEEEVQIWRQMGREQEDASSFGNADSGAQPPVGAWTAGQDAVSAVALHPLLPLCATTTGSRHWDEDIGTTGDEEEEEEEQEGGGTGLPRAQDASLRLWDLSGKS